MHTQKTVNPKLAAIRDMLVDAVHEGLSDPESKERKKASFLGVAVALLKMHGGPDQIQTPEEAAEAIAALRSTIPWDQMPKFDPPATNEDQDEQDQDARDF